MHSFIKKKEFKIVIIQLALNKKYGSNAKLNRLNLKTEIYSIKWYRKEKHRLENKNKLTKYLL